ncbi:FecR family protein [Bacteroides sp.]
MKAEKDIHKLAIQYFEGKISREDETALFHYIERDESHRNIFRGWEQEWIATNESDLNTVNEWNSLQRKMRAQEAIIPMIPVKQGLWRKIAAVAAIVILTAGSTLGVWKTVDALQPETCFTFEAPYGEKSKMILADGTVVWLNSGSTLKYSNKFNTANRKVELNGEGYFEVTRQEGATFVVQTRGYDVVVKGTKFNISAYPDDSFISTTLLEGAVELDYKGQQIKMKPGELLRLDIESGRFTRSFVNAIQSRAWAENRIEFDNITLKELVARLSRQYDVNIRLDSEEVGEKRFRISLRNRETIGEVMTALQKIIHITVERRGKDIYIRE